MTNATLYIIGATMLAFSTAFALSMFYVKRLRVTRALNVVMSPSFVHDASATPLWAGCILAWILLPMASLQDDRFYNIDQALAIGRCVFFAAVMLAVFPSVFALRATPRVRLAIRIAAELLVACVAVWQGVRFEIMSAPGFAEGNVWLGSAWGSVISVAWIFAAMQAVKLLGGLGGAAVLLLFVTAVALLWGTIGTTENVLRALTAIISGAALGALPFYFMRNGLDLRGSAMSLTGYLFALLTVLARSKAATTVLVFVPLAAILIAGVGLAIVIMDKKAANKARVESEE